MREIEQIKVEERVTVQKQKRLVEQWSRMPQCSARSEKRWRLDGQSDDDVAHAPGLSQGPELFRQMADQQQNVAEAEPPQISDSLSDERLAADRKERLRRRGRGRAEA